MSRAASPERSRRANDGRQLGARALRLMAGAWLAGCWPECQSVYFDRAGREVSYFLHHARALSSAAAVGHGRVIQRHVADLRTRSLTCPALPRP